MSNVIVEQHVDGFPVVEKEVEVESEKGNKGIFLEQRQERPVYI